MTIDEAREILKYIKSSLNDSQVFARHNEALDLAIKALEQQQDVHDNCKKCIEFSEFEKLPRWVPVTEQENVLEKIRAEIEKKRTRAKQMSSVLQMNAYTDCLQIIDKCRKKDVE